MTAVEIRERTDGLLTDDSQSKPIDEDVSRSSRIVSCDADRFAIGAFRNKSKPGVGSMSTVRRWWTVKELAEHYGLSPRTIYDGIAAGDLIAHRFGRGRG